MHAQQDDVNSHEILPTIKEAQAAPHERNRATGLMAATMRQITWAHFRVSFLRSIANREKKVDLLRKVQSVGPCHDQIYNVIGITGGFLVRHT